VNKGVAAFVDTFESQIEAVKSDRDACQHKYKQYDSSYGRVALLGYESFLALFLRFEQLVQGGDEQRKRHMFFLN
jgi:hypothetical protein